ncbi:BON domain-containing protein [Lichenihabitans psoromatis]|uniref:BON domain-containing protein n=1 Tax=Lichenihabitans psoromatis TaxID=2528642 RepID=UPI0010368468|nr:BON domain-containing protein [Lichenihabitans psoromatis]
MQSDTELRDAVQAALAWDPSITGSHIGVTARNGVVTLMGHVGTIAEKRAAELATRRVRGVRAIAENIEVRLAANMERSDEHIAACLIDRLFYDYAFPKGAIKAEVANGWVTLTGQVEWFNQKQSAEDDIGRMIGVTGVTNAITIKPLVESDHIADDITRALHRSWFFDPSTVHVSAKAGEVKLTGTVDSLESRMSAASVAWAAPGVTNVENDITVV